jgi:hypothetical protein
MNSKRHKVKNRKPDTYPSCILCGKGNLGSDPLQVVQVGGGDPIWTHGHCYAEVHADSAIKGLGEAKKFLRKTKFDARGAVKRLEWALHELLGAKECLVGKALWPNLC